MKDKPNFWLQDAGLTADRTAFYVNSETGLGRDRILEKFGEADRKGAIPSRLIEEGLRPGAVIGSRNLRTTVQSLYGQATGRPIGDQRARQLLSGYGYDLWRDVVTVSYVGSLTTWVGHKVEARTKGIAERSSHLKQFDVALSEDQTTKSPLESGLFKVI